MKKYLLVILFAIFIIFSSCSYMIIPDKEYSNSERRLLTQFPKFELQQFLSGDYFEELEKYLLDQNPFREFYRNINVNYRLNILGQTDYKDIYILDDHLIKNESQLKLNQVELVNKKILQLQTIFTNSNFYLAVVPDKNYYVDNNNLKLDYKAMLEALKHNLNINYIDLFPTLELSDYYYTDPHWRQEQIIPTANAILTALGKDNISIDDYQVHELDNFYGTYYSQLGLQHEKEILRYLTNDYIDNSIVTSAEFTGEKGVYDLSLFGKRDSYDIFLSGPQAFLEINNNKSQSDDELIIFRDSFGSSITPLLVNQYRKITLIDLRYMATSLINQMLDVKNQDVLILLSTSVINNGSLLK